MAGSALRRLMAEYKRKKETAICWHKCDLLYIDTHIYTSLFCTYVFINTELTLNPPEGIVAGPISEDNFFEWEALIA